MNNEIEIPLRRFKTLLVVDLEATCWADGRGPREDMETIEFGAVLVRMQDLKPVDARSWFIKPKLHPQLSEFCTELTSITQSQVGGGLSFEAMSAEVAIWLEPHRERLGWGSWGNYDMHHLQRTRSASACSRRLSCVGCCSRAFIIAVSTMRATLSASFRGSWIRSSRARSFAGRGVPLDETVNAPLRE